MRVGVAALGIMMPLVVAATPAAAQERKVELQELVFGTCPKVISGELSLADAEQLASLGFKATTPSETPAGQAPRAEKGEGEEKTVLSSGPGSCSVWFGGPQNPQLAGGIIERTRKANFIGSNMPARLGDGTAIFNFVSKDNKKRSVIMIMGDARGELGFEPATTVIMMDQKDQ